MGDEHAFGVLFNRYNGAVYNYAFRLTGSWADAEDLVAATFLTAWHRRATLDPAGDRLRPWLFSIVHNHARNHWRSARRLKAAIARVHYNPPVDASDDLVALLDDERQMAQVLSEIRALPRAERDTVALVVLGDLSYQDAADVLGIPLGTVRSRLARARERLRTQDYGSNRTGATEWT